MQGFIRAIVVIVDTNVIIINIRMQISRPLFTMLLALCVGAVASASTEAYERGASALPSVLSDTTDHILCAEPPASCHSDQELRRQARKARQQEKKTPGYFRKRRLYIGSSCALVFGDGLGARLNFIDAGYLFSKNLGLSARATYRSEYFRYSSSGILNPGINGDFVEPYTEGLAEYIGVEVGGLFSLPVGARQNFELRPLVGLSFVNHKHYVHSYAPVLLTCELGFQYRVHLSRRFDLMLQLATGHSGDEAYWAYGVGMALRF